MTIRDDREVNGCGKKNKKKMKRISDKNNHLNFKHTGTKHGKMEIELYSKIMQIILGINQIK